MTDAHRIAVLRVELLKQFEVLERIGKYIDDFGRRHADFSKLDTDDRLVPPALSPAEAVQ